MSTPPVTGTDTGTDTRVTAAEISDLIAWARRLTDTGVGNATTQELAAYQATKNDLITRITNQNDNPPEINR